MFNQLHFRSTAAGFKTYSPSLPTIALLDGLLEQANSQNPCRQLVTKHQDEAVRDNILSVPTQSLHPYPYPQRP